MKIWKRLWLGLALVLLLCPAAQAAEGDYEALAQASGADGLVESLPADVQELIETLGENPLQPETYTALSFSESTERVLAVLKREKSAPLQALAALITVATLSVIAGDTGGALRQGFQSVSTLVSCAVLLAPFLGLMKTVETAVERVSVLLTGYVPVYGAALAASGSAVGAVSYQSTLLAAAELLVYLIRAAILPALTVSLALGCTGTVTPELSLHALSDSVYKAILWVMGLFTTVFTFVLSLQQMAAAAGDSLGGRAVKFSLSSFVPVVGGALSEAYSTVMGCAGLLRSTVGCFGLAATGLILISPLVSCFCWSLCLQMGAGVAGLFRLAEMEKLCRTVAGAVRVLIGVLAVCALLTVLSTTVVAFAWRGGSG